ncbi:pectinesterase family protein [Hamadaea tsunoensis]|uniref:pectinesterase family protein n=1 Tax=Hamadaea tsunoensis TaxID=53368 RepID=UPI0004161C1B|nr:pectinesterase family protein [Hamadaea tsunoensis]
MTLPRTWRRSLAGPAAGLLAVLVGAALSTGASAATLFTDDFEDGNATGWTGSAGTWSVVADGSNALRQSASTLDARSRAGSASWTNYTVTARVKPLAFNGSNRFVALLARTQSDTSYYYVTLRSTNVFELKKLVNGSSTTLATAAATVTAGTWYTLSLTVSGSTLRGSVAGGPTLTATDSQFTAGGIGVATYYATASFDDISVADTGSPSPSPSPTGTTIVVAKDGTGNYTTVQAAVNGVPAGNTKRVTISIKPGTYRELVTVPATKPYISFVGTTGNATDVVITYDNAAGTPKPDGSGTYGTTGSSSVVIDANDFTAKNLTFANAFDEAAHSYDAEQAVAVTTRGDRLIFDNVRFLGNQDTLQPSSPSTTTIGRAYYRNCYVEGDVDFIFGRGTAVFDHCEIRSLNRGSTTNNGYVTAASTSNTTAYGFLFTQCSLTAASGVAAQSVHLGRPWHPGGDVNAIAQVLYRESAMGAHILPSPWDDMSGFSWRDARFSEYANTGPGSTVTADRPQLTAAQAANYTAQKYLAGSDGWNPIP